MNSNSGSNKRIKYKLKKAPKKRSVSSTIIGRKKLIKKLITGAIFGYFGGVVLTFLWFMFLTTQMNMSFTKSSKLTCVAAVIFTLGLSYNRDIRVLTFLILPNFFSAKGRSALLGYIFVVSALGPVKNILTNIEVLSKSIACGQEQLKEAVENMLVMMKRPLETVQKAVKSILNEIQKTVKKIEIILKRIRDLIISIMKVIRSAYKWLGNIVNICNKKIGTPFQRCMNVADEAINDCRSKLGILKYLCEVGNVLKAICYSVKFLDLICILVDFISDAIVGSIMKKLEEFTKEIKNMFYVKVKFHHKFTFKTVASKSLKEVCDAIIADIRQRTKSVFLFFGWFEIIGSFMFFRIILKAYFYKYKYLHYDYFDNQFITKEFKDIDKQRIKLGKEAVLPLSRKEERKYFEITSFQLTRSEKFRLARSATFLLISTIQLFFMCFTDYCLYWLLWNIRQAGLREAGLDVPPLINFNITGQSFFKEIYNGIINSFRPHADLFNIDPIPCLPNPKPPNFLKYFEIGYLVFLCWFLLIFEPYGLRLRQMTMRQFYPARAKERAIWLYSEIMMHRTSFVKFARRKARQKFLKDDTKEAFSCLDWLRAKTERFWIMRKILGLRQINYCMLCSTTFPSEKDKIECQTPNCRGKYCRECYAEMNNMCFICKDPIDYGDYSDISEERASSELDEIEVQEKCY